MKVFWLIYAVATLSLLVFCCWCLFGLQPVLCSALCAGAVLSVILLVRNRATLSQQKYLALVAVLAGMASVAVGFIAIFLLDAIGSVFH